MSTGSAEHLASTLALLDQIKQEEQPKGPNKREIHRDIQRCRRRTQAAIDSIFEQDLNGMNDSDTSTLSLLICDISSAESMNNATDAANVPVWQNIMQQAESIRDLIHARCVQRAQREAMLQARAEQEAREENERLQRVQQLSKYEQMNLNRRHDEHLANQTAVREDLTALAYFQQLPRNRHQLQH